MPNYVDPRHKGLQLLQSTFNPSSEMEARDSQAIDCLYDKVMRFQLQTESLFKVNEQSLLSLESRFKKSEKIYQMPVKIGELEAFFETNESFKNQVKQIEENAKATQRAEEAEIEENKKIHEILETCAKIAAEIEEIKKSWLLNFEKQQSEKKQPPSNAYHEFIKKLNEEESNKQFNRYVRMFEGLEKFDQETGIRTKASEAKSARNATPSALSQKPLEFKAQVIAKPFQNKPEPMIVPTQSSKTQCSLSSKSSPSSCSHQESLSIPPALEEKKQEVSVIEKSPAFLQGATKVETKTQNLWKKIWKVFITVLSQIFIKWPSELFHYAWKKIERSQPKILYLTP